MPDSNVDYAVLDAYIAGEIVIRGKPCAADC